MCAVGVLCGSWEQRAVASGISVAIAIAIAISIAISDALSDAIGYEC